MPDLYARYLCSRDALGLKAKRGRPSAARDDRVSCIQVPDLATALKCLLPALGGTYRSVHPLSLFSFLPRWSGGDCHSCYPFFFFPRATAANRASADTCDWLLHLSDTSGKLSPTISRVVRLFGSPFPVSAVLLFRFYTALPWAVPRSYFQVHRGTQVSLVVECQVNPPYFRKLTVTRLL